MVNTSKFSVLISQANNILLLISTSQKISKCGKNCQQIIQTCTQLIHYTSQHIPLSCFIIRESARDGVSQDQIWELEDFQRITLDHELAIFAEENSRSLQGLS